MTGYYAQSFAEEKRINAALKIVLRPAERVVDILWNESKLLIFNNS
jgi:hypothetical protein